MAHAIQLDRQRGPRLGHKVEDVDRVGQGAIAVEDVERIDVLRKETLGVRPVEWPARGVVSISYSVCCLEPAEEQESGTHARPPCGC